MITHKTKYALKALIYMGQHLEAPCVKTKDIAAGSQVPKKFLEQILLELKKARILNSIQGSNGGYYYLKKPEEITLADLFRILEGPIALVSCVSENFYMPCKDCTDEANCKIKRELNVVKNETLKAMQKIKLSDFF